MRRHVLIQTVLFLVLMITVGGTMQAQEMMDEKGHPLGCTCESCVMKATEKADFHVTEIEPVRYIGIRFVQPAGAENQEEIGQLMGKMYGHLMESIQAKGLEIAGPAFSAYYGEVEGGWDVSAGIPIKGEAEFAGDVFIGTLPSGKVLTGTHYGPYEGLETTYTAWMNFIQEKGYKMDESFMWEVYVDDPSKVEDMSTLRTVLYQAFKE